MLSKRNIAALLIVLITLPAMATDKTAYAPAKVVYDVASANPDDLRHILDRASLLQNLYGSDPFAASIVIVIHEGAIPLVTKADRNKRKGLVKRAHSLSLGEVIQFRLCRTSAKMQGFSQKDFDDFIKLVPMADAEIIQLQHDGYAYLR